MSVKGERYTMDKREREQKSLLIREREKVWSRWREIK